MTQFFKTLTAAAAVSLAGAAAHAVPANYDFTTIVASAFDVDAGVTDPTSPFVGTLGTASLSIDTDDISGGGTYTASGSEFSMIHDFGSGPQTFMGGDDAFGGAIFVFNPVNDIIDVFFDVVDDDLTSVPVEDNIDEPGIVDFSAIGFVPDPINTIQFEVQFADVAPIPLPAAGLLLLGGLGGLAAVKRRKA